MSEQTTLNGVKVSYKPKSDKPKVEHKKRSDNDKGKRTYYENGQSKPARGFGGKNKTFKPRMHERQKAPAPNPFLKVVNNPRFCAVDIVYKIEEGQSLSELLTTETDALSDNDKRFAQYLIYGALRQFEILEFQLEHYLQKPIKQSERHVYLTLLLAIYEITTMNTAEYAAVNNWVDLIRKMEREWAVGLTNGILRKVLREGLQPLPKNLAKVSLPKWLSSYVINHWGVENACAIADHFLTHPVMTIRVNPLQSTRDEYSALLTEAGIAHEKHAFIESAIVLKDAVSVANLPNFDAGMCSVQDASAQLAAKLLAPQKDEVIVDACAAPGGKTIAMLESNPELDYIFAIDSVKSRLNRVQENIDRVFPRELADKIQLIPEFFECFTVDETIDAMLLDVPCSATGIIHRHPDIKRLRQATDIKLLVETQEKLLDHAWAQLKAGGRLLYATCSILKDENEQQMKKFFGRYDDASETELDLPFAQRASYGYQILPVYSELSEKMDGFYYCLIQKAHA